MIFDEWYASANDWKNTRWKKGRNKKIRKELNATKDTFAISYELTTTRCVTSSENRFVLVLTLESISKPDQFIKFYLLLFTTCSSQIDVGRQKASTRQKSHTSVFVAHARQRTNRRWIHFSTLKMLDSWMRRCASNVKRIEKKKRKSQYTDTHSFTLIKNPKINCCCEMREMRTPSYFSAIF